MDNQLKQKTINTYNKSSRELAQYFDGIGSRAKDVAEAFAYFPIDQYSILSTLEIGCGNGRDAKHVLEHTKKYVGMDISTGMIRLAKSKLPEVVFQIGDITDYKFPKELDIIFAFASLLHLDKGEIKLVLRQANEALNPGGIFYISLKEAPYHLEVKEDKFGTRYFYFYQPVDIQECTAENFEVLKTSHQKIGNTNWFTIILRVKK
jgi:SAM-dependent methyltransferase